MNATLAAETTAPSTCPCAHCGLPSPRPVDATRPAFCCSGCKGAYELIRGWGLDEFYDLHSGGEESTVAPQLENFADLDDPQLMGLSAPRLVSGDQGALMRSELAITGLHCAACTWLIERVPPQVGGWIAASVNMPRRTVEVIYDPTKTKLSEIARTLSRLGYRLAPLVKDRVDQVESQQNRRMLVDVAIAAFCAANAMWIAVALYAGEFSWIAAEHVWFLRVAGVGLGLTAVLIPGRVFFRSALASLRTWTPHMDLPVAIGLTAGSAASVYGLIDPGSDVYFDSIAALVFFLLLGRWIQVRQQRRAGEAVAELTRLTPVAANRVDAEGKITRVPVEQIQVDDAVIAYPGESLPVDGQVISGASLIDRSLLTGESAPVAVSEGSLVEAGTDNLQSAITVRATTIGESTRIGLIAKSISAAAGSRTPVVQLANRIGGWFVIVVIGLALLTAGLWWHHPAAALANSVSLLIVACPCALALATPLAIALTVGRLARRRVLVRSGECLERLSSPGTIYFDKTGTLTAGRMQVTHWCGDDDSLRAAAAIEAEINHPVARAISLFAQSRLDDPAEHADEVEAGDVQQISGCGVMAIIDGNEVAVGNRRLLEQYARVPLDAELDRIAEEIEHAGASPAFVVSAGSPVAVLGITDPIRESSQQVLQRLQSDGWVVGLLSGDSQATADVVGGQLGIAREQIYGGLLPEQKLATIKSIRGRGPVVMVGDGVNDAAALAAADVGIAVRGGASASLAAAPVLVAGQQLDGIVDLVRGAGAARKTIIRNFVISLAYNILAVVLAIAGYITPLLAAVLMPISSISVLAMTLSSRLPRSEA
jgi:Cu2+-exporting ATPase